MNNYKFIPNDRHPEVGQLINDLNRLGFSFTPLEAYSVWDNYSDSMAAGWLIYNDEELIRVFERYGVRNLQND